MLRATLPAVSVVGFLACASASTSGSAVSPSAALDKPFTLKLGAAESIDGDGLRIQFERVVSDSRCPKGAQCIRAGEAVIQIAVTRGSTKESYDLKTMPPDASRVEIDRYRVTLVAVEPEPTLESPPPQGDYTATLTVTRSR